jgi:hypothetical protein
VSPRTRLIPLSAALALLGGAALALLALLAACGSPPQPRPTSPPFSAPSVSAPVASAPAFPVGTLPATPAQTGYPPLPTYTPYPPGTALPTTTAPTEKPATPTPAHAAKCSGEPTGAQILTLIKDAPGIPPTPLRILEGPFCSGSWSFTTVEQTGKDQDDVDPLMVVSTGKGKLLGLVTAGSDVCIDRVQTEAPSGIRVLACGF